MLLGLISGPHFPHQGKAAKKNGESLQSLAPVGGSELVPTVYLVAPVTKHEGNKNLSVELNFKVAVSTKQFLKMIFLYRKLLKLYRVKVLLNRK